MESGDPKMKIKQRQIPEDYQIDPNLPELLNKIYASRDIKSPDEINFELVLQKSEELNIEITEERVDKAIDSFLGERQIGKAQLLEFLSQRGQD